MDEDDYIKNYLKCPAGTLLVTMTLNNNKKILKI